MVRIQNKRILLILIGTVVCLILTGCSSFDAETQTPEETQTQAESSTQADSDIYAELENPEIPKIKDDAVHLAFVGDSVTFGNGVWVTEKSKEHTYPAYIERMMGDGYQALNYGVSGKTLMKEGDEPYTAHYMYDESINANADTYVIMLGSNDSKPQNWNTGDFHSELKDFAQAYIDLESHPKVFLATPPRAFEEAEKAFDLNNDIIEREIAPTVREVARELDIPMIDVYEKSKDHPEWFMDGSHPNATGNKAIAKIMVPYLTEEQ